MDRASGAGRPAERLLVLLGGHRLSPTQRRIAQYLLDHLTDAAFWSSVRLARQAGVSQPSVTRFAVSLGFSGYPALREALRAIVLDTGAEFPSDADRNELQAAVTAEQGNLRALHDAVAEPAATVRLGRELAASRPLAVLGLHASASLAQYFAYAAQRIHPDVRCLTCGGSLACEALLRAQAAGGRWLLAFAMPRYPAETVRALRYARQIGMRTAVVTDARFIPFADQVDVLLPAGVGSRLVFDSYAAPVVLAGLVLQVMADAVPGQTRARLQAHEEMAKQQGTFCGG